MKKQHPLIQYKDFGAPIFPAVIDRLYKTMIETQCNGIAKFQEACQRVESCNEIKSPVTADDYKWYTGAHFKLTGGELVILIPWTKATTKAQGTLERSIAFYTKGFVSPTELYALIDTIEANMQSIASRIYLTIDITKEVGEENGTK